MVDFVMAQLKNNVKSKVVSVYISLLVNKSLTSFLTKKYLNKMLAEKKKQHHQNYTLRY
jgi:hypothetical protein